MSQLPLPRAKKAEVEAGFTLMETMVALVILTIGLMSIALLMANVYKQAVRSRYVSESYMLASEKLEDLCSYSLSDPRAHLAGGTLTANPTTATTDDAPASANWNSSTITVDYYDTVTLNNSSNSTIGAINETFEVLNGSTVEYITQTFTADGLLHWDSVDDVVDAQGNSHYYPSKETTTQPSGETFLRTWQIQSNTPVTGVTTLTVMVALIDTTMNPPVTVQMSTVRP
jgi:prepilin-type N-terminal cleavage/methylation domain-containing protein